MDQPPYGEKKSDLEFQWWQKNTDINNNTDDWALQDVQIKKSLGGIAVFWEKKLEN